MDQIWLTVFLVCLRCQTSFSWNADAGIIESLTKQPGVTASATSNNSTASLVLDGDDNTNWVSSYCLPGGYIHDKESNVLLGVCSKGLCSSCGSSVRNIAHVTDGSVYTVASAHMQLASGGVSKLAIHVAPPSKFRVLTVNGVFHDERTTLFVYDQSGSKHLLRTFGPQDNYKSIEMFSINLTVSKIELESYSDFSIKEIAGIGRSGCIQRVVVDLGIESTVGTIRTRHWAGTHNAEALYLRTSADGVTWVRQATLNADALRPITTTIVPTTIRYIALEYRVMLDKQYKKVYCYEIDAWDEHGKYGPTLTVYPQTKTVREILGVNGIWGWGHNAYSNTLPNGEGPTLYNVVASHARNYHNLGWDVKDPDNNPGYAKMAAGHGTDAKWWLNWDTEYKAWKAANLYVDASIQFTNKTFPQRVWNHPEQSAYNYGREFAKHFGIANPLVDAIEVGNEPWDYDASFYATVLKGMSAGVRSANSNMTILPGAFQADNKDSTGNYIGTRVLPEVVNNIDVINSHSYSFLNTPQGVRISTYPEHKESSFNGVRSIIRWRNANTPTKPVWITEWGWDADGEGEDCTFPECVPDFAQALYGTRALLILTRSGVEKATWFFYANTACNTLFCRSGLTASKDQHFSKKTVFLLFEELLSRIGNKYFLGVLQENETGFVYLFGDEALPAEANPISLNKASYLVAWLPVDAQSPQMKHFSLSLPSGVHVGSAVRVTANPQGTLTEAIQQLTVSGDTVTLELTAFPILVGLVHGEGGVVVGK